jgi:5-methylcytosine-specific restriction endonuclease McrA
MSKKKFVPKHRADLNRRLYRTWRNTVLRRDGHKCQMPDCKYGGKILQIHHIYKWSTEPSLRYKPTNGITLCPKCHKRVTGNEEIWASFFLKMIMDKINDV